MEQSERTSVAARKPLVRCPRCESRLIHPVEIVSGDQDVIVERRCPDCEHRDFVVTSIFTAAVWYRRDSRTLLAILRSADALRDDTSGERLTLEAAPPETPGAEQPRQATHAKDVSPAEQNTNLQQARPDSTGAA